jgi:hypothetical protein
MSYVKLTKVEITITLQAVQLVTEHLINRTRSRRSRLKNQNVEKFLAATPS